MFLPNNLKLLRKRTGKTQDVLSSELKIGRTTIANYESGLSEPNLETVIRFANYFGITVDDILGKDLTDNEAGNAKGIDSARHTSKIPQVIAVDNSGADNILYVPVKARAGYLHGYGDLEYMGSLPSFRMPGLNNAVYRMFEVDGQSMAPTLLNGDRIIGEWVDDINKLQDNKVHIVVHTGGVAVKRIINRIEKQGKIFLKSDTLLHKHDYPTIEVRPEDIIEIWSSRLRISGSFDEPADIQQRIADLELDVMEMKQHFKAKK